MRPELQGTPGTQEQYEFFLLLLFFSGVIFSRNDGVVETFPNFGQEVGHLLLCVFFLLCLSSASCWAVSSFSLSVFSYFPFVHSSSCHAFVSFASLLLLMLSHIHFE